MHSMTSVELIQNPELLLETASRGEVSLVMQSGRPLLMTVPIADEKTVDHVLVDIAAHLFDGELISLGVAARIAGISHSEMIDELGSRDIPVIRMEPGELDRELAALQVLAPGRSG